MIAQHVLGLIEHSRTHGETLRMPWSLEAELVLERDCTGHRTRKNAIEYWGYDQWRVALTAVAEQQHALLRALYSESAVARDTVLTSLCARALAHDFRAKRYVLNLLRNRLDYAVLSTEPIQGLHLV